MPAISIILPVYNAEKYLRKCLDSILDQTFKDYELMIINDGSSDNSAMLCKQYSEKDNRIKFIDQENMGVSNTRRKALEYVNGIYLLCIDSDDWLEHDMLEKLYNCATLMDADFVYCDYKEVYSNKNIKIIDHAYILDKTHYINELLKHKIWGSLWNKMIKVKTIKSFDINFDKNINIWEDLIFILKCLKYSEKIAYVPDALYNYRINESGLAISNKSSQRIIDQINVTNSICNFFCNDVQFRRSLISAKLYAKYGFLLEKYYYSPEKWSSTYNIKLYDIIKSDITINVKILSVLAKLNLFFVIKILQKIKTS